MNRSDLTNLIRIKALELGFSKIGIAKAEANPVAEKQLLNWIDKGFNGSMEWIKTRQNERADIHSYFPEARSVISVALNYFTGVSNEMVANRSGELSFSNYAWGDDYHDILKRKLKSLAGEIKLHLPGSKGLYCVDTSPVMEKVWAQKAGLGWQGKHTNLITRDYGSWVFLGELITDFELDYDAPFLEDLCGSCVACIEACPTQALDEYVLDSNKCISYLTIEYRGDLSEKSSVENWVYGCDICQEVCPWNKKFAQKTDLAEFQPRVEIREWQLDDWIENLPDKFSSIFKGSPVKRTKASGLTRNIQTVINNKN